MKIGKRMSISDILGEIRLAGLAGFSYQNKFTFIYINNAVHTCTRAGYFSRWTGLKKVN